MLLEIKNLGIINKAKLEIKKINVIVGKNNTGKSISSKFLFSLLTAASNEGIKWATKDIHSKLVNFVLYWQTKGSEKMEYAFKQITKTLMNNSISLEMLENIYKDVEDTVKNNDFENIKICVLII